MKIDSSEIIAGQPALKIRELLKRGEDGWTICLVIHQLEVDMSSAELIVRELIKEGYIEEKTLNDGSIYYINTIKGNALACALAAKPIHRKTADKKLQEFMDRVIEVNRNETYLYKVTKVILFGSYLSNKERINDIDVAISLERKEENSENYKKLSKQKVRNELAKGRCLNTFLDQMFWPYNEVCLFLKSH